MNISVIIPVYRDTSALPELLALAWFFRHHGKQAPSLEPQSLIREQIRQ